MTNGLGNQAVIADATGQELNFTPVGGATIDGSAEAVDVTGTVNQLVASRQLTSAQTGTFYVAYLMRLVSGAWSGTATFSMHLADSGTNTGTLNFGARGGSDFMVRNGTGDSIRRGLLRRHPGTQHDLLSGGTPEQAGRFVHLRSD